MSTLNNSLNVIACGASGTYGFDLEGCLARIRRAKKALFTSAGYEFDGTQDFTDDYIATLVASGDVIVVDNINAVLDQSTQNTYEDLGLGRKGLDYEGLYEFKLQFIKGMYRQQALSKLNGDGKYDVCFVDNVGTLMGTVTTDGKLKGFTLGVHQTELIEGLLTKNTPIEGFMIQLVETAEMANYGIKAVDDDFNGLNIPAVVEIKLELTTPSDTDTSVTVKATRRQDGKPFTGAVFGQFNVKTNGTTTNPAGGDDSVTAGTYVLTGVTAISTDDIVSISLYDNTNSRVAIKVGTKYYKSNTDSKTAV